MRDRQLTKLKIITTFSLLFVLVTVLLLIVFYAGKKSFTVEFDLDGGILISGSLEQTITLGQDAVPPIAVKDGAYLRGWSESYKRITKDIVTRAVWEYETTPGIVYSVDDNKNFAEIESAYKYIHGEVYIGAYYGDKKVLGICQNAFENCTGITKVYLLDGLLSIGRSAFSGCTRLVEITIPKTVKSIGNGAFRDCESLETLVLNEGIWEIGAGAFENCKNLKTIVIPSTVTYIGSDAFRGCEALETVVLSDGIGEIGAGAFENCKALKEIIIPKTVTHIGSDAFRGCEALETVSVMDGLWEIGSGAFAGCVGLQEIILPSSIAKIEAGAFDGCEGLEIKIQRLSEDNSADWENGWQGPAQVSDLPILGPILRPEWPIIRPDRPNDKVEDALQDGSSIVIKPNKKYEKIQDAIGENILLPDQYESIIGSAMKK